MKILFLGSHGTGKSTLCNILKEKTNLFVYESSSRFLKEFIEDKYNITLNSKVRQSLITELMFRDFNIVSNICNDFIAARSPIDVVTYELVNKKVNLTNPYLWDPELKELVKRLQLIDWSQYIVFYIPIEFLPKDDGIRPTDIQYQKDVDTVMKYLADGLMINYHTITGSVEERIAQINKVLDVI